ncbi:hypothetical protein GCM10027579_22060 [Calidifontibacter terrae]
MTGAGAEAAYLSTARGVLPGRSESQLKAQGKAICKTVETGSRHDAVGELATQVGGQAAADRLVSAATAAYCPQVATSS